MYKLISVLLLSAVVNAGQTVSIGMTDRGFVAYAGADPLMSSYAGANQGITSYAGAERRLLLFGGHRNDGNFVPVFVEPTFDCGDKSPFLRFVGRQDSLGNNGSLHRCQRFSCRLSNDCCHRICLELQEAHTLPNLVFINRDGWKCKTYPMKYKSRVRSR